MGNKERPAYCTEEHLEFLDELRESGATNMWGATPFLKEEFKDLSDGEARQILFYWMDTFTERHQNGDVNDVEC
jgi:hypothetical protein